jgi:hypothetical protein
MTDDTLALFSFPSVQGKKLTTAFDGGWMSYDDRSDAMAEWRLGVAERLASTNRSVPRDR